MIVEMELSSASGHEKVIKIEFPFSLPKDKVIIANAMIMAMKLAMIIWN